MTAQHIYAWRAAIDRDTGNRVLSHEPSFLTKICSSQCEKLNLDSAVSFVASFLRSFRT